MPDALPATQPTASKHRRHFKALKAIRKPVVSHEKSLILSVALIHVLLLCVHRFVHVDILSAGCGECCSKGSTTMHLVSSTIVYFINDDSITDNFPHLHHRPRATAAGQLSAWLMYVVYNI